MGLSLGTSLDIHFWAFIVGCSFWDIDPGKLILENSLWKIVLGYAF